MVDEATKILLSYIICALSLIITMCIKAQRDLTRDFVQLELVLQYFKMNYGPHWPMMSFGES